MLVHSPSFVLWIYGTAAARRGNNLAIISIAAVILSRGLVRDLFPRFRGNDVSATSVSACGLGNVSEPYLNTNTHTLSLVSDTFLSQDVMLTLHSHHDHP